MGGINYDNSNLLSSPILPPVVKVVNPVLIPLDSLVSVMYTSAKKVNFRLKE